MTRWDVLRITRLDGRLIAIFEPNRKAPRDCIADMVHLAALGLYHGLDAIGPTPARLQCRAAQSRGANVDDLHTGLLRRSSLVCLVMALNLDLIRHRSLPGLVVG